MKIILSALIIILSAYSSAEDTGQKIVEAELSNPTRPRSSDELNNESSSFVPDPDSLDPFPVKNENLKENEEPVLEDIRQVVEAPSLKKTSIEKKSQPSQVQQMKSSLRQKKNKLKAKNAKKKKSITARNKKESKRFPKLSFAGRHLKNDAADLNLENKFHKIYQTYNAEPTSIEGWTAVLKGRPFESYTVQKNDTLWSISKTLFGDATYWPKLWSLNKKGILNPHFITPGFQVVFYAGTADELPSLAVSEKPLSDDDEQQQGLISREAQQVVQPATIPDSLPISRNDNYFSPRRNLKIELMNQPDIPEDFTNNIILTDRKIISEAEISLEEIMKGRCGGKQVLKASSIKGQENVLKIYESLETLETDAGEIYPYRLVGEAQVVSKGKIKITKCDSVMSKSLFFVSPSQVASWRTNKMSSQAVPIILGGPNLGTQLLFSNHQLAYLNMGSQNPEIGQSVKIKSQLTEQPSGEIRIIDKFGSFAIGIVTDTQDLIEKGDEVLMK